MMGSLLQRHREGNGRSVVRGVDIDPPAVVDRRPSRQRKPQAQAARLGRLNGENSLAFISEVIPAPLSLTAKTIIHLGRCHRTGREGSREATAGPRRPRGR
jgi:hypothetical protein